MPSLGKLCCCLCDYQIEMLMPSLLPYPLIFSVFLCTFPRNRQLSLDPAEEYKMNNKRRGLALIFNQEHFFWKLGMPPRFGTNADRHNLERRYRSSAINYKMTKLSSRTRSMTVVVVSKNFQCCTPLFVFYNILNSFHLIFLD